MSRTLRSANSNPPTLWPTGREHLEAIANKRSLPGDHTTDGSGENPIPDLPNEESEESENMSGGAPAPAAPPVPAAAPPEVWKTDPLLGNFNPGTKHGHLIFESKTKGLPEADRLDLSKKHEVEIQKYLKAREGRMGTVVTKIPTEWDGTGAPTKHANLLTQYQGLTLPQVQRAAHKRYNVALAVAAPIPNAPFVARALDPANVNQDKLDFYEQVNSSVVAKIVENMLTAQGFTDLLMAKDKFAYVCATSGEEKYDGPTMLFLVLQKIDPNTVVGLDGILKKLENVKLGDHGNNVDTMLTYMEKLYKNLKDNGRPPENYRRLIFDALKTGPNHDFSLWVKHVHDEVNSGIGHNASIDADKLIIASRSKYNNMVDEDEWGKVDPRDAQLLALQTEFIQLKKAAFATQVAGSNSAGADGARSSTATSNPLGLPTPFDDGQRIRGMAKWRTIKKQDSVWFEGHQYWWCPHHKQAEGLWNGLYVKHPPERHDAVTAHWKAKRAQEKELKNEPPKTTPAANPPGSSLQLQSRLKEVLCTNLCLSASDVDKIFAEAQEN